jgi:DNA-binding MarR family transcriptional regulator
MDAIFKVIGRRILVHDDAALDIPLRQFRVCATLFEGPRSMKELSVELGVSQSAITQIADRLEAAGLVRRGAPGDDRRVKNLELTPRARKVLREREEQRIDRVREILEQLSSADRQTLLESLGRFGVAAQELDGAND